MSLIWPLIRRAVFSPKTVAVIDDQRSYTYGSLLGGALFLANAIEKKTAAKHVGIMLPTSGVFPMCLFGAWLAGRVAVPLNYLLAKEELAYVIADSDIDTLITVGPMLDFIGGAEVVPSHIQIIKLDEMDFKGVPDLRWPPCFAADDLAVLLYTSGTSGRPKGVMLSHGNLGSNVRGAIAHAGLTHANTFLGMLPQFHSFGLTALTLMPLHLGAKVVYTARFIPKKVLGLIKKHRPDVMMAVPSMYGALLSIKGATAEDLSSIKIPVSGGEPLPDATYQAYLERFGLQILEGYGLTETAPVTHWSTQAKNRLHAVGNALPRVDTFIVDDADRLLGANQDGEILLAGPNIMQGYYKLPTLTDQVITHLAVPGRDGLVRAFRSGDIGHVDEGGFLFITGRKKEMLIISGENVFPREIEEVLNGHPAVRDSAVIGKTDDVRGEVPVAFVEINEDAAFDESALRNHCRQSLAPFKVPREIRLTEALPRNPTGKIMRRALKVDA